MTSRLQEKLLKREKNGNLRQLSISQNLIDFSSNDYLGLAKSSKLKDLVNQELQQDHPFLNVMGSTGSRLLTGNTLYAQDLETKIASFHGFEAGLLFNCGFMANLGLISAVAEKDDVIFFDSNVHASTHAGICLSKANAHSFRHNDIAHLEQRLKNCATKGSRFICVESIYSTDGSIAPLAEVCQIAKKYEAHVIVDEAHAVGVCGFQGRGLIAELNLCSSVFAQITTFGKAIGVHGAIVLGSDILKQSLINFSIPYIYTTALPMHALIAINCSYSLMVKMEKERSHIQSLINLFRNHFPNASNTHIQSISVKGNDNAKKMAQLIVKEGFDVRPLLSPTVQRGKEILRICLHEFNTETELKALLDCIKRYLND